MNKNSQQVFNILQELHNKLVNQEYVVDKSGVKLLQILDGKYVMLPEQGHHLKIYNEDTGYVFMQSNEEYISLESKWHESRELNINMVNHVKIWRQVASSKGEINSNYGWCVFDPANGSQGKSQFEYCLETLKNHKESRQALIIYTRPTMHTDSKRDGMHDFLCTISNQFLIRDGKLEMIYTMKGQDLRFGLPQNVAWAIQVYNKMLESLKSTYPELDYGKITFNVGSLHLYENQFKKLRKLFSKEV